jgi:hypothetical protein
MMTRAEIEFFESLTERQLRNDSCICRSHRAEAKRHLANPDYVPKWNKEKSQLYICCSLDECTATSHNFKIIRLSEDTKQKLLTSQDTLCEFHYQELYRQAHQYTPCAFCGAKPKVRSGPYTRHSPDAMAVSNLLLDKSESCIILKPTDTICKTCYDMHLAIIQHIKTQDKPSTLQLHADIEQWEMQLKL